MRHPANPWPSSIFRYEALNRSAAAQRAVAHPRILAVIEPLLGEDCHVISNTCWHNQPTRETAPFDVGNPWHIDAGPHVPRPAGVPSDARIPYPVFRDELDQRQVGSSVVRRR